MSTAVEREPGQPAGVELPGPTRLALRPLGYVLLAVLWATIWLITLAIPAGALAYLAFDDPQAVVATMEARFGNPVELVGIVVVLVPLLAMIMGPGAIFHLPTMSWPLAVLALTYVVRSLRPSYARERLSFTSSQSRGESLGPPGVGDVALSLLPVRSTRFTDLIMRFYVAGWSLDGRMFRAMLPVGAAWCALVVVVVPGFSSGLRAAGLVLAIVLTLTSVVLGIRAFRSRFASRAHGHNSPSTQVAPRK